jgi:cation diffusion facilitator CzcD-associated flavoprotein CzcO
MVKRALLLAVAAAAIPNTSHRYCILGGGPGGIQMAYLLQTAGMDYVVFEREAISAEFYTRMPVHRKLISINKKYTGQSNFDFNMRHDWNSFVQDLNYTDHGKPLLFGDISDDYWPHADDYVKYVNMFVDKYKLNIKHNHTVKQVTRITADNSFSLDLHHGDDKWSAHCDILVQATGSNRTYVPDVPGKELLTTYDQLTMDLAPFKNKSVLIIGCANAAWETAVCSIYTLKRSGIYIYM